MLSLSAGAGCGAVVDVSVCFYLVSRVGQDGLGCDQVICFSADEQKGHCSPFREDSYPSVHTHVRTHTRQQEARAQRQTS